MDLLYNEKVGQRIKDLRKEKKISMAKLGELVNLHESTINRYEQGKIKSLDIDKIKEFAKALDTTPAFLMGWEEQKKNIRNAFSKNLKNCMKADNLNICNIAEIADVSVEQVNAWLNTEDAPTLVEIQKIADYFNISIDQFENTDSIFSSQSITLSYEEKQIIDMYRSMSNGNKEAVFTLMKNLSDK